LKAFLKGVFKSYTPTDKLSPTDKKSVGLNSSGGHAQQKELCFSVKFHFNTIAL
jgi:hypothetical protein